MTLLRVVDRDGTEHEVDARTGLTVMENLRDLDYGVAAVCGGMCACATCHVYVDAAWLDRIPAASHDEEDLLYTAPDRQANSRLSCQILLNEQLDGLKLTLAPSAAKDAEAA